MGTLSVFGSSLQLLPTSTQHHFIRALSFPVMITQFSHIWNVFIISFFSLAYLMRNKNRDTVVYINHKAMYENTWWREKKYIFFRTNQSTGEKKIYQVEWREVINDLRPVISDDRNGNQSKREKEENFFVVELVKKLATGLWPEDMTKVQRVGLCTAHKQTPFIFFSYCFVVLQVAVIGFTCYLLLT